MLIVEGISRASGMVRVRALPGIECCLALWAARAPEREPRAQLTWQIEERMPDRARARIRELDATVDAWPLRVLNAVYRLGADDLEAALAQLEAEPAERLAQDLGIPARRAVAAAGPLTEAMSTFWRAGFGTLWERRQEALALGSANLERRIAAAAAGALERLSPRAAHDADGDRLFFCGGQGTHTIDCNELEVLDVVPSTWLRRRVVVARAPGAAALAVGVEGARRPRCPVRRTVQALAALGEQHRFEIVRMCMAQPRSTKELATELRLTQAPVSRHLKELQRHGLVVSRRAGRYVLYEAVPEELAEIGSHLSGMGAEVLEVGGAKLGEAAAQA